MATAVILDFWNLGLSNSQNFIGCWCLEGPYTSLYQISSKSVIQLQRYCDFSNFQIGHRRHLWCLKSWNFIGYCGREGLDASACQISSISCEDIKIFRIFKMAAAAILDFWNCKILLVIGVQRVETHQYARFRQNRSISCEEIKIFRFFKTLDLFGAYLDNQQWVFWGLYYSAKFGYDRWSSFYNMSLSIFGPFGWKMPIHAPKIVFFGGQFDPLNGLQYQLKPRRHTLAWVRVIWAIKHENVVSGLTCRCIAWKRGINKKRNIVNISPTCPEAQL